MTWWSFARSTASRSSLPSEIVPNQPCLPRVRLPCAISSCLKALPDSSSWLLLPRSNCLSLISQTDSTLTNLAAVISDLRLPELRGSRAAATASFSLLHSPWLSKRLLLLQRASRPLLLPPSPLCEGDQVSCRVPLTPTPGAKS